MADARKVIITCAVTGSIHTPTMSPYLPITPEQIAENAIAAAEAGAAILHLHARDPRDGRPTPDPAVFMEFLPRIHAAHRRGDQHHDRRRRRQMTLDERLGGAAARAARDVLAQHGLDELRALPHGGSPHELAVRLGAALPREHARHDLQEHVQGHRRHPAAARRRLRNAFRIRVLRRRPSLHARALPGARTWSSRRCSCRRSSGFSAGSDADPENVHAHADDRRQALRPRDLRVVDPRGGAPSDGTRSRSARDGRARPRRPRGQPLPRARRAGAQTTPSKCARFAESSKRSRSRSRRRPKRAKCSACADARAPPSERARLL